MHNKIGRNEKLRDAYLILGSEYFAIARYAAAEFYMPICATMFHHAIELLIKGYLINSHSSKELKYIGHKLCDLWNMFKIETKENSLIRYQSTITNLDRTENLRYPDAMVDNGFELHVGLGYQEPIIIPENEKLPKYFITVNDIDEIANAIFTACAVNPKLYFRTTPSAIMTALPLNFRPY
jgi:hypothetical protein